jgi:hypothetical protein
MATRTTVLTVAAAAMLLGVLAAAWRVTRTRQPATLDQSYDDMRRQHHDVRATEFPPRSHGDRGEGDQTS